MVKDGRQHIESLRDGRRIFIDGTCVDDHTPTTRRSATPSRSAASLFDYQAQPQNLEQMTFTSPDIGQSRQPDVAAAHVAGRAGRAPPGARSLGGADLRDARAVAGPRRLVHLRDVHGPRSLRAPQRCPGVRGARLLRVRPRQRSLSHLRHHQPAGRPQQERRRAVGRVPRRRRLRRGSRGHHHPRRRRCSAPDARWPTKCSSAPSSRSSRARKSTASPRWCRSTPKG